MAKVTETSQTLGRGLDVLELVAASPKGLTPAQIATALGLSRTIVYRLVVTLAEHRLVRRGPDGLLTAGLGTLALSRHIAATLRAGTRDVLEKLAQTLGATAHLAIAEGDEAVAVSVVEPTTTTFHLSYRVGSRTPIHLGAVGRALQAAREGQRGLFESEGQLIPGAKGVVAALPAPAGLACCVGVVTLSPVDTSTWGPAVERAADEIMEILGE
ncbi:MAG TPA: helix-turn-helix domain-containing protein [Rugosimonospora sp.]|nr:helix-turn-helix domain-containing protein [Rugosimonospora sp.]